jgi:6-phosphofructokinase
MPRAALERRREERLRAQLRALEIDALVVIGGNGSLAGAHLLGEDHAIRVLGLPASIDNDIGHCGLSIGVDTACNTIVEACDRISDHSTRPSALDRVIGQRLAFASVLAAEAGAHDVMLGWEVPGGYGAETADPSVRVIPLAEVLAETERQLDGTSPIVKKRMELLRQVEHLLAL